MENCNFPRFFHCFIIFSFFYHIFIICLSFFIIFASSGAKIFQKIENCNFPRVFFIFNLFLIMFSSFLLPVVQKFSKKWKIAIFLEFFSCFYHFSFFFSFFLIMFHHFCFQWCKNLPKNGKLQFSIFWIFLHHWKQK